MTMKTCDACKRSVAANASRCPHCGRVWDTPLEGLGRFVLYGVVAVLLVGVLLKISGCRE